MNRKYRQQGYQDGQRDSEGRKSSSGRSFRDGPRSPRMTKFQKVFRCTQCGTTLPRTITEITGSTQCPSCSADLHTCKHCVYFDPASRFECTQTIQERIAKKDKKNLCRKFEPRTTLEKATSSAPESSSRVDPREAFERLFKK